MKRTYSILLFLFVCATAQTQVIEINSTATNVSCATATPVCDVQSFNWSSKFLQDICDPIPLYFSFNFTEAGNFNLNLNGGAGNYVFYGPLGTESLDNCEMVNNYSAQMTSGAINSSGVSINFQVGKYILQVIPNDCSGTGSIGGPLVQEQLKCEDDIACSSCITSFKPTGGYYILSAWVKEVVPFSSHSLPPTTYSHASIQVSFEGSTMVVDHYPSGKIIDGWQKIEGVVNVPNSVEEMKIKLMVADAVAYFDDIRFYPFDGSMMSYVYDPLSLRLMAELDERNYATLYEYDEEGKLIRVKKETEKGIMTIQENRDNIKKRND